MGIVLPEGVLNNPSLRYVREYVEDRAFLQAVVSLPQETFLSSGASVKASLLFLRKFTNEEKQRFDEICQKVKADMIDRKTTRNESRLLLKQLFDYQIFMYEAERVGITATGEDDQNELYPNERQPDYVDKTCLEWYHLFLDDSKKFIFEGENF